MNTRGRLHVLLGAAPGAGKTRAMLEEGRRLADEGRDVVIAAMEPHGRDATAALAAGIPRVPCAGPGPPGSGQGEVDVEAVLARRPEIALVDELAHANAPGSRHEKRWQDVAELIDAGIDVVSTLNVEHIESLNDAVLRITGVPQRETIPDDVLREAEQIELIDVAPQVLRARLASGLIHPAERIDAALSHYFSPGSLTALRELALLWLADESGRELRGFRVDRGLDRGWEARERVVVALSGGPEGEALLRRGARIAARSGGGELVAVHVAGGAGLRVEHPLALAEQRILAGRLGAAFHQVVGDDVPSALIGFARSIGATQIVLGAVRRGRLAAAFAGPGIAAAVVRESADIDVHIVARGAAVGGIVLPRFRGALTARRRVAGFAIALLGGPLLMWLLGSVHSAESIATEVLSYQLLVVIVALVGGIWPALFAAVLSGITLDLFFIEPHFTVAVADPVHLFALLLHIAIAVLVSYVVDRAARQTQTARRAAAESELMQTVAGSVLSGQNAVQALVDRARDAFSLSGVRVVEEGVVVAASGEPLAGGRCSSVPLGDGAVLELHGPEVPASEQRLLAVVAAQLTAALERRRLAETASGIEPIAASDRVRGALLSALSHDLRGPLAAATAAVGGLRAAGDSLSAEDARELLETAEESLGALTVLVTDLLDVSRVRAGALTISLVPLDPADAVAPALDELEIAPGSVELALGHGPAQVLADPVLLQRAIVNVIANAIRHSPDGTPVRIATSAFAGRIEIRIVDRGPGIPAELRDEVFLPFQRLGDTDNSSGLGLGLALSRGFVEAMHGALNAEDTPGGGLTMVIALPMSPAPGADPVRTAGDGLARAGRRADDRAGSGP